MAKLKSKKALLHDARLVKSDIITMSVSSSNYDSNSENFSATIQDSKIESFTDAGGTATRETPITSNYVSFTKEEIAVAEKTFTQEQLAGKSFGEITEMIILAAILGRIKTEKFYGSIATDWEFVV